MDGLRMRERLMDIERRKFGETAEGKQSVGPRNRQTARTEIERESYREREKKKRGMELKKPQQKPKAH